MFSGQGYVSKMTKPAIVITLALLAAAGVAVVISRRAMAGTLDNAPDAPPEDYRGESDFFNQISDWTKQTYSEIEANVLQTPNLPYAQTQIAAMLETISKAEGTAGSGDPYRVCYGYRHTIASFADHPAITGEWRGEKLSDAMCKGAGLSPGCVSTAAGKYQIIRPTWANLKAKLNLSDFSPESQDLAAIELLRQRGAITPLEQGRFEDAVFAARKEWASLKGAGYGQGERSIAWLTQRFTESGGVLA